MQKGKEPTHEKTGLERDKARRKTQMVYAQECMERRTEQGRMRRRCLAARAQAHKMLPRLAPQLRRRRVAIDLEAGGT